MGDFLFQLVNDGLLIMHKSGAYRVNHARALHVFAKGHDALFYKELRNYTQW